MTDGNGSGDRVFGDYAGFYDALYKDKDYEAECDYLEGLFARFAPARPRTILDLGCGTGNHVLPLTERGYEMVGVDRSAEMIDQAQRKAAAAGRSIEYRLGDVRDLELGRTFDAVIEMFAVIGYQCTNEDLLNAIRTARRHLEPGGLFVFDAWFGPAVLMQGPTETSKKVVLEDGDTIERYASPVLDVVSHTVEVRYGVTRRSGDSIVEETHESHRMRYLFPQEIAHYLGDAGFELLWMGPFMAPEQMLTGDTWNVSVVARAC